jgi:hypothetical protein
MASCSTARKTVWRNIVARDLPTDTRLRYGMIHWRLCLHFAEFMGSDSNPTFVVIKHNSALKLWWSHKTLAVDSSSTLVRQGSEWPCPFPPHYRSFCSLTPPAPRYAYTCYMRSLLEVFLPLSIYSREIHILIGTSFFVAQDSLADSLSNKLFCLPSSKLRLNLIFESHFTKKS